MPRRKKIGSNSPKCCFYHVKKVLQTIALGQELGLTLHAGSSHYQFRYCIKKTAHFVVVVVVVVVVFRVFRALCISVVGHII